MAFKRLALAISVYSLAACSAQADMAFKHKNDLKLYQHYALTSCVATAFTQGAIYQQAVTALNGYREFGAMPLEAYEALIAPMQLWLKKDYASHSGIQNNLMKCIDFAESDQVSKLYREHS